MNHKPQSKAHGESVRFFCSSALLKYPVYFGSPEFDVILSPGDGHL